MDFYNLTYDRKIKEVQFAEGTDWEEIRCPEVDDHQRAGNRIGPLRININQKKIPDFMWTFLSDLIINDKVADIFSHYNFTGYKLQEVEVCNMEVPYQCWEFLITGKGGKAHPKSGLYLKESCEHCGLQIYSEYEKGIYIDESNWDGSDMFSITEYPGMFIFTQQVKDAVESNNCTGYKFTPLHEMRWPKLV